MIAALLLMAAGLQAVERDPTWGRAGGWVISRGAGSACIARNLGFELAAGDDGAALLTARDPRWAARSEISTITISFRDAQDKRDRFSLTIPVRHEPGKGLEFTLTENHRRKVDWTKWRRSYAFHNGRGTKGEALGSYQLDFIDLALMTIRACSRTLAKELAAQPTGNVPTAPLVTSSDLISNDDYPAAALHAEQQGRTVMRLHFAEDGYIERCEIAQSSGSATLDDRACQLFQWRVRLPRVLDESGLPRRYTINQSIVWQLPR